ncbi:hypothetical protein GYMLUDRAFT_156376, partial [Collybiopsis luxurians FD-317 M1]
IAERSNSLDQDTVNKLEKHLSQRPEKTNLVERAITNHHIDDKGVAPALIAAKERLQRSQLEDKLGQALQQRPKPEELVKEGILLGKPLIII